MYIYKERPCENRGKTASHLQTKEKGQEGTDSADTLILDL